MLHSLLRAFHCVFSSIAANAIQPRCRSCPGTPRGDLRWLLTVALATATAIAVHAQPLRLIVAPEINEGDGVLIAAVELPQPAATPTLVTITATILTPSAQELVIPAGSTRGFVFFELGDDNLLQGPRQAVLRASADAFQSTATAVLIDDNDTADLTVEVPATVTEGGSGLVFLTLSRPANYAVTVTLVSGSPGLSVTTSVSIASGATTRQTWIWAVNDGAINGSRSASFTVSVPAWNVTKVASVRIEDDDQRTLTLQLPATIPENATNATGQLLLGGSLPTDLEVALSSSAPGVLAVPPVIVVPAGLNTVTFPLAPMEDAAATGKRTAVLNATAEGFTPDEAEITIQDVTLDDLALSAAPPWALIGQNYMLNVVARNADRQTIAGFAGAVQAIWESTRTGETIGQAVEGTFAAGTASFALSVPDTLDGLRVRVSVGELTARTGEIRTYRLFAASAQGLAIDRQRGRILYTAGAQAGAGFTNTLVSLDPRTGERTPSVFLGSDPRTLAISDDSSTAYIGLWTSNQIVQLDLATGSVVRNIQMSAGSVWSTSTFTPYDIAVVPGASNAIVVGQDDTASTFSTVVLYRDGALASEQSSYDTISLTPSRRPGVVFGYNNTDTGYDFGALTAQASSLTLQRATAKPFEGFNLTIEGEGDYVIGTNGVVADGQTLLSRGKLSLPASISRWAVAADADSRRFYAADATSGLYIFDAITLRLQRQLPLPAGLGTISEIKRWGQTGLALRLATGAIVTFVHPDIAPTAPPADVEVTFAPHSGEILAGTAQEFAITARNHGPNPALEVRVGLTVPSGFAFSSVQADGALVETSTGSFLAHLGTLASGASRTVRFALTTNVNGPNVIHAAALTSSIDENGANNVTALPVSVVFADQPNSARAIQLYAVDVVAHPSQPLIYVSTGKEGAATLAHQVLEIDARTGKILRTLLTGDNPRSLAITDGGEFLYVALGDVAKVLRVKLADFSVALAIPLPPRYSSSYTASDLVTLPGQPRSIAVSIGSYYGVSIIDDTTSRTSSTGLYDGNRVERGPTSDTLVAYDNYTSGFELTRLRVTATGVTQEAVSGAFSGYSIDFVSSGALALNSQGRLVDTSTMTLRGQLQGLSSNYGTPALEATRQRAYAVVGSALRSYDTHYLASIRELALPVSSSLTTLKAIRWGADGFAILQQQSYTYSGTTPYTGQLILARSDMVPTAAPYAIELLIDQPSATGATVQGKQLSITGRAFAAQGMQRVTVNGEAASPLNSLGQWSYTATLVPGRNEFVVVATSAGASPESKQVTVVYDFVPPLPAISSDAAASGEVGAPFHYAIQATLSPQLFSADGLPPGLAVDPQTGVIGGTPTRPGVYLVRLAAANQEGWGTAQTLSLRIDGDHVDWLASYFTGNELTNPAISGGGADPDADGWPNLLEYALGLDPRSAGTPDSLTLGADENHWFFSFRRPKTSQDISVQVAASSDLVTWASGNVSLQLQTSDEHSEVWQASVPRTGSGRMFFRLEVRPSASEP